MQECVVSVNISQLYSLNTLFILAGLLLSLSLKQHKQSMFCATLLLFYWLTVTFHCHIKAVDPDEVYRYLIWSGIDLIFLVVLYGLVRQKLASLFALVSSCVLELVAITNHIMRALDIKMTDGAITDHFYSEGIMLTNVGFILLALVPPLCVLLKRK